MEVMAVQAHRNYLIIKGNKPPVVPTHTYTHSIERPVDITLDIDYNKLQRAMEKALIASAVAVHNAKEGV